MTSRVNELYRHIRLIQDPSFDSTFFISVKSIGSFAVLYAWKKRYLLPLVEKSDQRRL